MNTTDNDDQAAVEALAQLAPDATKHGRSDWMYVTARAILDAIRLGNVPGIYCTSGDFHDMWQAAEKDLDRMRSHCEAAEKALELACKTRNAAVDATQIVCLERDRLRAEVDRLRSSLGDGPDARAKEITRLRDLAYVEGSSMTEREMRKRVTGDFQKVSADRNVVRAERDRLAGLAADLRNRIGKIMPERADCECADCLFMRSVDAALAEVGK